MAHTRHYRSGLGHETAAAILEEHAGSQWDPRVVSDVLAVVREWGDELGSILDRVDDAGASRSHASCADALPEEVLELLAERRE